MSISDILNNSKKDVESRRQEENIKQDQLVHLAHEMGYTICGKCYTKVNTEVVAPNRAALMSCSKCHDTDMSNMSMSLRLVKEEVWQDITPQSDGVGSPQRSQCNCPKCKAGFKGKRPPWPT